MGHEDPLLMHEVLASLDPSYPGWGDRVNSRASTAMVRAFSQGQLGRRGLSARNVAADCGAANTRCLAGYVRIVRVFGGPAIFIVAASRTSFLSAI